MCSTKYPSSGDFLISLYLPHIVEQTHSDSPFSSLLLFRLCLIFCISEACYFSTSALQLDKAESKMSFSVLKYFAHSLTLSFPEVK